MQVVGLQNINSFLQGNGEKSAKITLFFHSFFTLILIKMGRKKQIFLQLYTKDYTGDERLRMCSPAAWGVYSYLLCLLNSTKVRGCYRLSLLEQRPDLKRSFTQRVLNATSQNAKTVPFADILQRQMPWKKTEILKALKELLFHRVIVIEDDAIIQPRMYREGGNILKSDIPQEGEELQESEGANGGENNDPENAPKMENKSNEKSAFPAHAIAHARSENMSYENINNDNNGDSRSNIGGVGEEKSDDGKPKPKTPPFIPPTLEEVKTYFAERGTSISPEAFWAHYEANGWVQSRGKPIKNWKACLTTWEQRRGEFGTGHARARPQKRSETAIQREDANYDNMETW